MAGVTQINRTFNQFQKRVQTDIWEKDFGWVYSFHLHSKACTAALVGHRLHLPISQAPRCMSGC